MSAPRWRSRIPRSSIAAVRASRACPALQLRQGAVLGPPPPAGLAGPLPPHPPAAPKIGEGDDEQRLRQVALLAAGRPSARSPGPRSSSSTSTRGQTTRRPVASASRSATRSATRRPRRASASSWRVGAPIAGSRYFPSRADWCSTSPSRSTTTKAGANWLSTKAPARLRRSAGRGPGPRRGRRTRRGRRAVIQQGGDIGHHPMVAPAEDPVPLVHRSKQVGVAGDRLRQPEEEAAAGPQRVVEQRHHPVLQRAAHVDQQVAAGRSGRSARRADRG